MKKTASTPRWEEISDAQLIAEGHRLEQEATARPPLSGARPVSRPVRANTRPAVGTQEWLDYHRKREQGNKALMQLLGALLAFITVIAVIVTAATGGFKHTWADCVSGVFAAEHVGPFNGPSPTTMYDAQVKCGQGHGKVYSDLYTITLGPRDMAVPPSDQ